MLPVRIGLVSQSQSVDFANLVRVANALTIQLNRDAGPIWGISGSVVALPGTDHLNPGTWPIYIADDLDPGMAGNHSTDHNQPFALVEAGDSWSLTASHEMLEMAVDPSGNRLVAAPAVAVVGEDLQDAPGKFEYLVEVCDASQHPSCAYLIDDVLVSDFYTPAYFDPAGTAGARYSFKGKITRPRQVLPGGYLTWINPATSKMQQVQHFGTPQIVDVAGGTPVSAELTGGRSLRSFVDGATVPPTQLSRLASDSPTMLTRASYTAFLANAGRVRAGLFGVALERLTRRGSRGRR